MLEFKFLGDVFEWTYKRMYMGEVDFESVVGRIVHMLGLLADVGMITNTTKKNMEAFLTKDIDISEMRIISRNTNNVVLINTDIHEQESFNLSEYIIWITDELCKDPIIKKSLCKRNNYESVKRYLNSYADKDHGPMMKDNWVDFYICEDKIFYTRKDEDGIYLYIQDKKGLFLPFSEMENSKIVREKLVNGTIYHFEDDTLFVETDSDYIVKIRGAKHESRKYSKIGGKIIDQLEDGSLILIENDKLIELKLNGRKKVLVNDAILGVVCTENNKVFWKKHLRKKELDIYNHTFGDEFVEENVIAYFKDERICKEMLWKGLLFTFYNFDSMKLNNKIGSRLRFSNFFDKIPVPFDMNEVMSRLSEIDKYCYTNDIVKTDGYTEAMSYLMSIENDELDEKQTYDSLVYLLDNVTVNPYKMIANDDRIKVLTAFDFFFDDINQVEEKSVTSEDVEDLLMNLGEIEIDAMIRSIDRRIAELEEEERREKEAIEKAKNQSSTSSTKEVRDKGKPVCPDESVIGRSAEGIKLPTDA